MPLPGSSGEERGNHFRNPSPLPFWSMEKYYFGDLVLLRLPLRSGVLGSPLFGRSAGLRFGVPGPLLLYRLFGTRFAFSGFWLVFQAFDAPSLLFFPMPVFLPASPVAMKLLIRNSLVVPSMPPPAILPVIIPPARGYPLIKVGNPSIVSPTRPIVARTIPAPLPRTPPPAVVEKNFLLYVRNKIDIRLGYHHHFRWRGKYDGRGQGNGNAHRLHRWNRNDNRQPQKQCSDG